MQTASPSRQRRPSPSNSDPCLLCGKPVLIYSTSAGRGKMTHRACKQAAVAADSPRPTQCAQCGESFRSQRRSTANGGVWVQCCSKACARRKEIGEGVNNLRIKDFTPEEREESRVRHGELSRRKRRARLAGVPREPYTTALIAERDGFTCSLCSGLVDMAIKWPDLQSPSVDHVMPISCGGDDTLANVALAHFGCNVRKSNRT